MAGDSLSKNSEGGIFNCKLKFPESYPDNPPKMKFVTPIWHPNVYQNGDVCISILHSPGTDQLNQQESAMERWRPVYGVVDILNAVMIMLDKPNPDSPENVDAGVPLSPV